MVIYTGQECRAAMNNSQPRSKIGLIDEELNSITKVLILATVALSVIMVMLNGFDVQIPAPLFLPHPHHLWSIGRDKDIPGCQAGSTTISEELGRISYLLSEKHLLV